MEYNLKKNLMIAYEYLDRTTAEHRNRLMGTRKPSVLSWNGWYVMNVLRSPIIWKGVGKLTKAQNESLSVVVARVVGRLVTVVVNGTTVIYNQPIPGITGGALDSNEGEPGPIMMQGDHGPIEYRNIVITPAIK